MSRRVMAAVVVERQDRCVLIALPSDQVGAESPLWRFPRGEVGASESPEDAARRIAVSDLGLEVEVDVGQPPLPGELDGETAEFRYMFCGVCGTPSEVDVYPELRWVLPEKLKDYAFSSPCDEVVGWMGGK